MIIKEYSMKLENELHLCKLVSTESSKDAIFINSTDPTPSIQIYTSNDSLAPTARQISSTVIAGNSSNIIATDIVVDGEPYFYKWFKFELPGHIASYSVDVYSPSGMWVYSKEKNVSILFRNAENIPVYSMDIEFIPVFIDSRYINLKDIMSIDGKKFSSKKIKNEIVCTFSKDIKAYIVNGNIFESIFDNGINKAKIKLQEFLYTNAIQLDGINAIIKHEYFPYTHTLIRNFVEKITVGNSGIAKLSNKNIDISSVVIISINGYTTSVPLGQMISPMSGSVSLATYMQMGLLGNGDIIEIKYSYLYIERPTLEIDLLKLDRDSEINTYVRATEISKNGTSVKYDRQFGAVISKNGFITSNVFDMSSIDISQSGASYVYNYMQQNQIVFMDGNIINEFYTTNIDEVDRYLNSKGFKSCGVLKTTSASYELSNILPGALRFDFFKEFQEYQILPGSITILGNENPAVPAGIGKIRNNFIYPLKFNIDSEKNSYLYIKVDISKEEIDIVPLLDSDDNIEYCKLADEIGLDFSYNKNKISAIYESETADVVVSANMYFDSNTKELYIKVPKMSALKLRLKYNGIKTNNCLHVSEMPG